MTETTDIFQTIAAQYEDKSLFDQARNHAFDYLDRIHGNRSDNLPVYPSDGSLAGLSVFEEDLPNSPGNANDIVSLLHTHGSPATLAQTGGRYFGFVNGGAFPAALAAKWLADVWDQNAGLYVISPIAACLEAVCESWLKELFHLPPSTVAGFVSGTSAATLCGLTAARNQLLTRMGWDVQKKGTFNAPRPRVILGGQAHSTVFKALSLIGFGMDDLEIVACDSQGRMKTEQMPKIDHTCLVIAQAGNVATGAFDDLDALCTKAEEAWVHVDGAFGLWAAGSTSFAHLTAGMEKADSWSVDAHKTLNTPYDSGIVLCRHEDALVSALQNSGAYIHYSDQRDPMLYTPEMSRRARGVELWATIKFLGKSGIESLVNRLCGNAKDFSKQIEQQGFTLLNEVVFNQVLICCEEEKITRAVLENIQSEGTCWCGSTTWQGKTAIRVSICSWATTAEDIALSVQAFVRARKKAMDDSHS